MADGKFPKPYVNDVKQNDSTMKYVNAGDFAHLGIGGRPSGLPKDVGSEGMNLEHVGDSTGKSK